MNRNQHGGKGMRAVIRWCLGGMAIWAFCDLSTARAGISYVDFWQNNVLNQTGNGNSLSNQGSVFYTDLYSTGANDYSSASLVYPGAGSPVTLSPTGSPGQLQYQTGDFSSQSNMEAAFPTGNYLYTASNGDTTTLSYQGPTYYPQSMPYLTGSDYGNLQGMDAKQDFTFHFSPLDAGSLPPDSSSYIFFRIFDLTNNTVPYAGTFLDPTTTSVTVAGNTLAPGDTYMYQLIYSNYTYVTTPNTVFNAEVGYAYYTDGSFTASAVPEPATVALFGPASALVVLIALRRRAR